MPFDRQAALDRLRAFDFSGLFTQELGWDWYTAETTITVATVDLTLKGVAEKRGVHVLHCPPVADGRIPDAAVCAAIERQVVKIAREHLLIFTDAARTEQVWLYPRREPGKPIRLVRYRFETGTANELLLQKLSAITFTLNEEEGLNLLGVVERLKDALDRDVVTKSFYQQFDRERLAFQEFLKGIPDEKLQRWYVAVLLNRLMFIYFIQQKGFLGGHDQRYLQNKLVACRGHFYRDFLCPLFFQGFALRPEDRPAPINAMLGQVPYLNGGLFQRHHIEEAHGRTIEIANEAFRAMFAFFDRWRWHLDEHPLAGGNEIDPSILGYIFERYINAIQPGEQKAKGAYYTKEDITGYIARNTIIPRLFDMAAEKCRTAFEGDASVWNLLAPDPDRYIYAPVRHGVTLPLPPEIEEGVDTKKPHLLERRAGWNKPAPSEYALPTEIWREVVARRQRYAELHARLSGGTGAHPSEAAMAAGPPMGINDLITLNLDIVQFAQDVVENAEPDLLWAFYGALKAITVLDPTCGSGAFLFAAVNILEPLYSACLSRMETFLDDGERGGTRHTQYRKWFRKELDAIRLHRNQNYFIFKTIILNNLYGVDIMDEAIEICKLRLFLKLAAQIEPDYAQENLGIEPLPDIDFNIRAGNTFVGFATEKQAEDVIRQDLLAYNTVWPEVQRDAKEVAELFGLFRQQQTEIGGAVSAEDKARLREKLAPLEGRLSTYLAGSYDVTTKKAVKEWIHSHRPFHWFIEFYEIMAKGGFDVIVGNPPWKEIATLKGAYTIRNYEVETSGNLYALCSERSLGLLTAGGGFSFIVQLPIVGSSRMSSLREYLVKHCAQLTLMPCDDRPGKLFDGLQHCRNCIFNARKPRRPNGNDVYTTRYNRWATETRSTLFNTVQYSALPEPLTCGVFPKLDGEVHISVWRRLLAQPRGTIAMAISTMPTDQFLFYQEATQYWVKAVAELPYYAKNGKVTAPAHGRYIYFSTKAATETAMALLNSSLFYTYFIAYGDCFHLSDALARSFPVPRAAFDDADLQGLARRLSRDLDAHATRTAIDTKDGHRIEYAAFNVSESKPIIDEIDRVLAKHYGFTDEEMDFIINYDIKYRMGRDGGEAEAE